MYILLTEWSLLSRVSLFFTAASEKALPPGQHAWPYRRPRSLRLDPSPRFPPYVLAGCRSLFRTGIRAHLFALPPSSSPSGTSGFFSCSSSRVGRWGGGGLRRPSSWASKTRTKKPPKKKRSCEKRSCQSTRRLPSARFCYYWLASMHILLYY